MGFFVNDKPELLDDQHQPLAHTIETAAKHIGVGSVIGGVTGALASGGKPSAALLSGAAGATLGAVSGISQAYNERKMERMGLKEASVQDLYQAGCAFAQQVLALPPAEKAAFMQAVDSALGHVATGLYGGAGRLIEGAGQLGSHMANHAATVDKEIAGRVLGGAGLVAGGALALHKWNEMQSEQRLRGIGAYPGPYPY